MPLKLILAGLALLTAAGCSGGNVVDTGVDSSLGFQPGNGAPVVYQQGHRYAADHITGTTLDGKPFDLASWHGKIVVVNFWSSDCGPCRAEAQAFNQVARDDAAKGVAFLGVDERDSNAQAKAFEAKHGVPYPSLSDPTGRLTLAFPHSAPASTPATLVLDRQGRIAARVNGALDYTHLVRLVNYMLGERT